MTCVDLIHWGINHICKIPDNIHGLVNNVWLVNSYHLTGTRLHCEDGQDSCSTANIEDNFSLKQSLVLHHTVSVALCSYLILKTSEHFIHEKFNIYNGEKKISIPLSASVLIWCNQLKYLFWVTSLYLIIFTLYFFF